MGVIEHGEVVYRRGVGELVAGSGEPVTPETLFKIASNSKSMTTALLARLVDAGKLRWDDPVTKHLPQFRMYDDWVTREMQVRDLLIHDSGLRAGAGDLMLWPEPNSFSRADVIHGLRYLKPVHSFRSRYDYDNLMYIVAGEVAAAAGGAPYEILLQREVFEPLGLQRCRIGEWNRDSVGNVAQPHRREGDRNLPVREDGAVVANTTMAAAGGVRCSLDDMLTWVRTWLRPDNAAAPWLSAEQRRALWSAQMSMPVSQRQRDWDGSHYSAYGYGWRLADVDGTFKVSHTGTLMGMYSVVTMLPERDVGFVVLINGEAEEARTVLNQVLVKRYSAPAQRRDVAYYAQALERERAATPPAQRAPDTSARKPATTDAMRPWLGRYGDPWFGEVSLCAQGARVRFVSRKSPMLSGTVQRVDARWLVDWDDVSVDAEAWLDFGAAPDTGTMKMAKVDPEADFSYDYEDLAFVRVGGCD
ncbi:penicillin-binding protein [Lysobacter sp. Root559]|nr:penicillin-binding protein [Lysobacter sp. Root559]KRC38890.1 penicillin-binding protein [Lysobacter sp. Root76]KRD71646.1 penicillin-binding protein [Lysobacter sp. Root96]